MKITRAHKIVQITEYISENAEHNLTFDGVVISGLFMRGNKLYVAYRNGIRMQYRDTDYVIDELHNQIPIEN